MTNKAILLANSIWFKNHENHEVLENNLWIKEQLERENYDILCPFSDDFLKQIMELRGLILEILSSKDITCKLDVVNSFLSKSTYVPLATKIHENLSISWQARSSIENQIISEITQDLVNLFSEKKIDHVKICSNDACRYYYIDNSKNKSKKFCCSKCSNLIKVRRHRSK